MSIDREINARVEAYRDNPQALQAKYARNKQLVDLLALQSLKSDLDKKRSQMELALNTNPATIKQQREQEVFGRTAEDVAQQLGGLLQTAKNQQIAQRRPAPQGLGALMPQQGQRPQQPQTRMMQAGGIVGFQTGELVEAPTSLEDLPDKGVNQGQLRDVARAQIKQLLEGGVSPEVIKQEVPPQYVGLVDEVVQKSRATAPPGMMEEVVVTGQREPDPLSAEGMMREQAKTKQTKDKNIAEIPVPKDITPEKPTPKKKTLDKPEGIVETLFGEQGAILPLGLEKESGIRDRVQYAIDTNVPLSRFSTEQLQSLRSDNDQYTPKIEAELAKRQSEPKQGIAAVAEEVTATPQTKPPQDKAEGIAAVAEQPVAPPSQESFGVRRSDGNVQTQQAVTETTPQPKTAPPTAPQGFDLQTALDEVGDAPAPVMVDRTGLEKRGVDFTKAYGMDPASIDPEARGVAALEKAEDYYGVKKKDAELRKGLAELAALDAAQTDPDKLRRDRLKAFLLGAAGRGSTALAASGAASANLGARQERDIRARQVKRNEMLKTIQDQDLKVRELAKGEERAAIERADNLKMEGMRIISTMSNAELSARQTEANAINESNIANYQAKMERVGLLLEQSNAEIDQAIERAQLASIDAQRRGQIAQSGIDDAMRRKSEIGKMLEETYRDQVNADPTILSLRNSLADPNLSSEEAKDINAAIKKRLADIKANLAIAQQADLNEIDQLNDKILELENLRNKALGGGIADIPVSTQEQSLVDQYK
jgi:hypothetical protein